VSHVPNKGQDLLSRRKKKNRIKKEKNHKEGRKSRKRQREILRI